MTPSSARDKGASYVFVESISRFRALLGFGVSKASIVA